VRLPRDRFARQNDNSGTPSTVDRICGDNAVGRAWFQTDPDGTRIVSIFQDIRMWNFADGTRNSSPERNVELFSPMKIVILRAAASSSFLNQISFSEKAPAVRRVAASPQSRNNNRGTIVR